MRVIEAVDFLVNANVTRKTGKEMIKILMLSTLNDLGVIFLLVVSFFYFLHLRRIKRQRPLTGVERSMYIITQAGYLLWAGSKLLMLISN